MTNFVIPQIFDHETNQANLIIKSTSSFNALTELKNGYCDLALISASSQPVLSADISVKKIFDDEIISVSKKPLEREVTSLIVSKSKIDVYKILEKIIHYFHTYLILQLSRLKMPSQILILIKIVQLSFLLVF